MVNSRLYASYFSRAAEWQKSDIQISDATNTAGTANEITRLCRRSDAHETFGNHNSRDRVGRHSEELARGIAMIVLNTCFLISGKVDVLNPKLWMMVGRKAVIDARAALAPK